jgi:hypothetical protein
MNGLSCSVWNVPSECFGMVFQLRKLQILRDLHMPQTSLEPFEDSSRLTQHLLGLQFRPDLQTSSEPEG